MHVVLLEANPEITALVAAGCAYLGIDLVAIADPVMLELPAARRVATDLLILDCSLKRLGDLSIMRLVGALPEVEVLLLGGESRLPESRVQWLPAMLGFPALLEWLRGARARTAIRQPEWPRHPLSDQQWRIARLIEREMTQREIAGEERVHIGTIKVQVGRILDRWPVDSTAELRLAVRHLLATGVTMPVGKRGARPLAGGM